MSATDKMLISDTNLKRTVIETDATIANVNSQTPTRTINIKSSCSLPTHVSKTKEDTMFRQLHGVLLDVLDMFFSCLVVAPCVVACWRGTWELMGVYIYPNNPALSALVSFLIGAVGHMVFTLLQFYLTKHIHPDKRRLTYYIVSRLYTAIFGFVCVNMWRGSWMACDLLTSADSIIIIFIVTITALLFMIATRTLRNLASPPFSVATDHKNEYFEVKTLFTVDGFKQSGLFILDTLFSVFVIGTLIVIAWRGSWGLIDLLFMTHNRALSSWVSLLFGYVIAFVRFAAQPIIRYICSNVTGNALKLMICDIYHLITFLGAVNIWRGIWNLTDIYIFPATDNKVLGYWVTTLVPYLLLVLFKCANSVLVRGVFIDAEGPHGDSLDLQIGLCKSHFEYERQKKQAKEKLNFLLFRKLEQESHNSLIEKPLEADKNSFLVQQV